MLQYTVEAPYLIAQSTRLDKLTVIKTVRAIDVGSQLLTANSRKGEKITKQRSTTFGHFSMKYSFVKHGEITCCIYLNFIWMSIHVNPCTVQEPSDLSNITPGAWPYCLLLTIQLCTLDDANLIQWVTGKIVYIKPNLYVIQTLWVISVMPKYDESSPLLFGCHLTVHKIKWTCI